jgi:hypothetical protein
VETLHFSNSLNKAGRSYRWQPAGGLVLVIFTLLGAAAMVFGFLRL